MDELTTPLGVDLNKGRRRFPAFAVGVSIIAGLAVFGTAWVWVFDDPLGGQPTFVAPIERTASAIAAAAKPAGEPPPPAARTAETPKAIAATPAGSPGPKIISVPPPADAPALTATRGGAANPGAVVITDPTAPPALALPAADVDALIERTAEGALPRIAADGRRPMDVYARPADAMAIGTARVAIVVGGIGISETGTADALDRLPGEVTLAFAPYGNDVRNWAAKARRSGHELLLQVPLEPFGYPNNDPGPDTLLVGNTAAENLTRLRRMLSRIGTYVGVTNYMGARFTSEPAALSPVMSDLAKRGLLYLDDGTSSRSKAKDSSSSTKTPFIGADLVIDAVLDPAAIDDRLDQLVTLARERGFAVGMATAYPVTIARIAAFAKGAAADGVAIVPLTTLVSAKRP